MTSSHTDPLGLVEQLSQEGCPENGVSDTVSFISKSQTHSISEVTRDKIADENLNDKRTLVKVSQGTMTDIEDCKLLPCKYCTVRMSVLRKIEKVKSMKEAFFFGPSGKYSGRQADQVRRNQRCQTPACLFERAEMRYQELRRLTIVLSLQTEKSARTETLCKCVENGWDRDCRCGEEDRYVEWVWDTVQLADAVSLKEQGSLVVFHQDFSSGTTAVRGSKAMDSDQHFWEIKMTTPVYGTDMMIGVGTEHVQLNKFHNAFCSMLGTDMDSWGISYDGRVQHGGRKWKYCGRFGQGTIIGVHLDLWQGTLTFYKNRHSMGIAFGGLQGRTLYPMVCSTAARSSMRVISSRSFPTSLQFMCCQALRQFVPSHLSVLDTIPMPPGLRVFLASNISWLLDVPHKGSSKPSLTHICDICMPLQGVLQGHTDDEDSSDDDETLDQDMNFRDSDQDSDDDPEDFSDRALERHSVTRYLMQTTLKNKSDLDSSSSSIRPDETSFSSGSNSDIASPSLSSLSPVAVGASTQRPGSTSSRRQLVTKPVQPGSKKARISGCVSQDTDSTCGNHTQENEDSSKCMHQTQTSDLTEESSGVKQKCLLGKRKHT